MSVSASTSAWTAVVVNGATIGHRCTCGTTSTSAATSGRDKHTAYYGADKGICQKGARTAALKAALKAAK